MHNNQNEMRAQNLTLDKYIRDTRRHLLVI